MKDDITNSILFVFLTFRSGLNDENVNVFVLDENGKFQLSGMYAGDDQIPVNIFNGDLKIDLLDAFSF